MYYNYPVVPFKNLSNTTQFYSLLAKDFSDSDPQRNVRNLQYMRIIGHSTDDIFDQLSYCFLVK